MKIRNIPDVTAFLKAVDSCQGKVELVNKEGDCLNLRSKLCQYVAIANIFSDKRVPEFEILIDSEEDRKLLMPYLTAEE